MFLDPRSRDFYVEWAAVAKDVVAALRIESGRNPYDRGLTDLIGELSTRSDQHTGPESPDPEPQSVTGWSHRGEASNRLVDEALVEPCPGVRPSLRIGMARSIRPWSGSSSVTRPRQLEAHAEARPVGGS